jgi:hypothetical protein
LPPSAEIGTYTCTGLESTTTRASLQVGHGWALHIPKRRGWFQRAPAATGARTHFETRTLPRGGSRGGVAPYKERVCKVKPSGPANLLRVTAQAESPISRLPYLHARFHASPLGANGRDSSYGKCAVSASFRCVERPRAGAANRRRDGMRLGEELDKLPKHKGGRPKTDTKLVSVSPPTRVELDAVGIEPEHDAHGLDHGLRCRSRQRIAMPHVSALRRRATSGEAIGARGDSRLARRTRALAREPASARCACIETLTTAIVPHL